ncbi:MAG: DUF922 domain-containing protein [Gemmatimonadota bacterium]|nr:DUF922 domain-containing protein [Gemmatimonadota bacterium]
MDVRHRTVLYEVAGSSVEEISASLDRAAPRIEGGRFRGTTEWNVQWRFGYAPAGSGCSITELDVDLHVTTTVPRWSPPPDATRELVALWRSYRSALDAHEAGHRAFAVEAANEVARTLRGLRSASCVALPEEANARGHAVVERFRRAQRRYDRRTGHGRTQGAGWPPDDLGAGGAIHAGSPDARD